MGMIQSAGEALSGFEIFWNRRISRPYSQHSNTKEGSVVILWYCHLYHWRRKRRYQCGYSIWCVATVTTWVKSETHINTRKPMLRSKEGVPLSKREYAPCFPFKPHPCDVCRVGFTLVPICLKWPAFCCFMNHQHEHKYYNLSYCSDFWRPNCTLIIIIITNAIVHVHVLSYAVESVNKIDHIITLTVR
jgi:hypothetical protein